MKAIKPSDFERIDVDITLHTKAIGYPSDARLGERVQARLVEAAHKEAVKSMPPPSACLEDC
jgi:IS5 family transposase